MRRLIDAGVCVRVDDGLIVPGAVLERPAAARSALANVGYVRKFMRDLHAVGFDGGPAPSTCFSHLAPNGRATVLAIIVIAISLGAGNGCRTIRLWTRLVRRRIGSKRRRPDY